MSQDQEGQEVLFMDTSQNELIEESGRDEVQTDEGGKKDMFESSIGILSPNVVASCSTNILSPEAVRPYPKRNMNQKLFKNGREKGKSRIYTDTPEKDRLQSIQDRKDKNRELKQMKEKAKMLKTAENLLGLTETKKCKQKRVRSPPDSDSSQHESLKLNDDSDNDLDWPSDAEGGEEIYLPNPEKINIEDFLLVKFEKKKSVVYYVSKVISKYNLTDYHVSYLRKKPGSYIFVFPNVEDQASVEFRDVVLHLPKPNYSKGTSRTSSHYTFSVNLSAYNVQ